MNDKNSETWVAVDDSGARHEANVSVEGDELVVRFALGDVRVSPRGGRSVRQSVAMAARAVHIEVVEVIAWGESTRGEMAASLHATLMRLRDAHAEVDRLTAAFDTERKSADALMLDLAAMLDTERAAVATARSEGAREMRDRAAAEAMRGNGGVTHAEMAVIHAIAAKAPAGRHDTPEARIAYLLDAHPIAGACELVAWMIRALPLPEAPVARPITDDGGVAT